MTLQELKDKRDKLINHLEWIESTKEYNWGMSNNYGGGQYMLLEHKIISKIC